MLYGTVPDTISHLIRTVFIPEANHHFLVADFSAIEARLIAWLAQEDWVLDVFRTTGKIYEATASQLYGVPVDRIKKGNPEYALRQYGKAATLALGYQGGSVALITAGHLPKDTPLEQLDDIKIRWRKSNKRIVDMWYTLENMALRCIEYGESNALPSGIAMTRDEKTLTVTLPSGRQLFYIEPRVVLGDNGRKQIWYYGTNQTTRKWELIQTYGGKLTENIVQAVARDCLAYSMHSLYKAGYKMVMHIHDEVVIEAPLADPTHTLDNAISIMCTPAPWAKGLPLNADGFTTNYYKKD